MFYMKDFYGLDLIMDLFIVNYCTRMYDSDMWNFHEKRTNARRLARRENLSLSPLCVWRGTERRKRTNRTPKMMSLTTSTFAPKFSVKTPATTTARRAATTTTRARLDSGVGAFGSKAGMTQIFTDDGLCVPVTVIAVREGNIVTQVCI